MQRSDDQLGRKVRYPVEIDAVVHRGDGSKVPVKLIDFSDQGCRIESQAEFHVGEKLSIAVVRMGNIKAQVRWITPGLAGTRFLTESDV